jgi:hypothetical protein
MAACQLQQMTMEQAVLCCLHPAKLNMTSHMQVRHVPFSTSMVSQRDLCSPGLVQAASDVTTCPFPAQYIYITNQDTLLDLLVEKCLTLCLQAAAHAPSALADAMMQQLLQGL